MGLSHVTLWDFSLTIHDSNMFLDCVQVKSTWIKSIWKFRKRISHIAIIKPVYYFCCSTNLSMKTNLIYIFILYIYIRRFDFASPPFFFAGSCIYKLRKKIDASSRYLDTSVDVRTWRDDAMSYHVGQPASLKREKTAKATTGRKGAFCGVSGRSMAYIENAWKCLFLAKGLYDIDFKNWIGWDLDCMFIISRCFMMFQPYSVLTLLTPSELAVFSTLT